MRFLLFLFIGVSTQVSAQFHQKLDSLDQLKYDSLIHLEEAIKQAFVPVPSPRASDWLATHHEPGQSFPKYVYERPNCPTRTKNKIYLAQIGKFDSTESHVFNITKEYLFAYYGLEVDTIDLSNVKLKGKCKRKLEGNLQWNANCLIYGLLKQKLPQDAVALMGITTIDLYPSNNWNFVFGLADLHGRVGISSMNRYYTSLQDSVSLHQRIARIIKTTSHEIGHMFSIEHCTAYSCNMNGSNTLDEADRQPLLVCPQCLSKLSWCIQDNPKTRLARLKAFYNKYGFEKEKKKCQVILDQL